MSKFAQYLASGRIPTREPSHDPADVAHSFKKKWGWRKTELNRLSRQVGAAQAIATTLQKLERHAEELFNNSRVPGDDEPVKKEFIRRTAEGALHVLTGIRDINQVEIREKK